MADIVEYDYYDASLTVTIVTSRPNPLPSVLFVAGTLHNDLVAKIRAALREKKAAIEPHLPTAGGEPIYAIKKITPAGTPRAVDDQFAAEISRQRFDLGISILPSAWQAGEAVALAIERHIEFAVKQVFAATGIPATIPGDRDRMGETFVDVICECGAATNQGVIHDVNE